MGIVTTENAEMDHAARRDRLRAALPGEVEALLVTNPSNIRYLCGFTGSNGSLLVCADPRRDRLATDFRYVTQCASQCPDLELVVDRATMVALLNFLVASGVVQVGFEAQHVTVAGYGTLQGIAPLVPTVGLVEGLRLVKDDIELGLLAEACRLTDAALAQLIGEVRVGQTERQIARRLDFLMLELGATAISFDTIVAAGPNSAIPHHSPTDREVAAGDFLKIDFGAEYAGYHADETRTFVVGARPADWQSEIYALVRQAQAAGVAALEVGAELTAVDAAARSIIVAAGHGEHFGHGLGHGVGLDIHEAPLIGYATTGSLLACTPVTVEPGVYLPGRGGVRIEDTLVVRPGGPESLTTTTRDLLVL
jgi:Xaa-Pro aminopeptidase